MKKFIKLSALLLLLIMSVCVFSGCVGTFYLMSGGNKVVEEPEKPKTEKTETEKPETEKAEINEKNEVTKEALVGTWYIIGDVSEKNGEYIFEDYDEVTSKVVFKDSNGMDVYWAGEGGFEATYTIEDNVLTYHTSGYEISYEVVPYEGKLLLFEIEDGKRADEGFVQTKNVDGLKIADFE